MIKRFQIIIQTDKSMNSRQLIAYRTTETETQQPTTSNNTTTPGKALRAGERATRKRYKCSVVGGGRCAAAAVVIVTARM